jgi:hypothetical protein
VKNSRDADSKENKVLAFDDCIGLQCQAMANKRQPKVSKAGRPIQLRANPQDFAIIQAGMRKHGLDMSQILRMALRRFAEAEGLKAS